MGQIYSGTIKPKPYVGVSKVKAIYRGIEKIWNGASAFLGVNGTAYIYKWENADLAQITKPVQVSKVSDMTVALMSQFVIRKSDGMIVALLREGTASYYIIRAYRDSLSMSTVWERADKFYTDVDSGGNMLSILPFTPVDIYILNNRFYIRSDSSSGYTYHSNDGIVWRSTGVDKAVKDRYMRSMEYHKGNYFTTINTSSSIMYTFNSTNWTSMTEVSVGGYVGTLKSNGEYLFGAGDFGTGNGRVSRSLTGTSDWIVTNLNQTIGTTALMETNGGNMIAIGNHNGTIVFSKDNGVTWGIKVFPELTSNFHYCRGLTFVDGAFIFAFNSTNLGGNNQYMIKTEDFITWSMIETTATTINRVYALKNMEGI